MQAYKTVGELTRVNMKEEIGRVQDFITVGYATTLLGIVGSMAAKIIPEEVGMNIIAIAALLSVNVYYSAERITEKRWDLKLPYYVIEAQQGNIIYRAHLGQAKERSWQFEVLELKEKDGLTYYKGEHNIPVIVVSRREMVLLSEASPILTKIAEEIKRANKAIRLYRKGKEGCLFLVGAKEENPPLLNPKYKIVKKKEKEAIPLVKVL